MTAELLPLLRAAEEMNRTLQYGRSPERTSRIIARMGRAVRSPRADRSSAARLRPAWRWAAVGASVLLLLLVVAVIWASAEGRVWPFAFRQIAAALTRAPAVSPSSSANLRELDIKLEVAVEQLEQIKAAGAQSGLDVAAIEALISDSDDLLAATQGLAPAEGLPLLEQLLALLIDEEETLVGMVGSVPKGEKPRLEQCVRAVRQQAARAQAMLGRWQTGVPPALLPVTATVSVEAPPGTTRTPAAAETAMQPDPSATPPAWGHTQTPQPPGQTKTPEPPGQTKTPQPPGQTRTPQPPGQTKTVEPPGHDNTPQPPGLAKTPKPTKTPKP